MRIVIPRRPATPLGRWPTMSIAGLFVYGFDGARSVGGSSPLVSVEGLGPTPAPSTSSSKPPTAEPSLSVTPSSAPVLANATLAQSERSDAASSARIGHGRPRRSDLVRRTFVGRVWGRRGSGGGGGG